MFCPGCGRRLTARIDACTHCGLHLPEDVWRAEVTGGQTEHFQGTSTLIGSTLEGRYRVDYSLARGGMAEVFSGTDLRLSRRVAIKVLAHELRGEPIVVERFLREAHAVAQLDHLNIVPVYSSGEHHGAPYIVMKYLGGETVADRIRALGRLPVDEAIAIVSQVCDGLGYVHGRGLVHRDIKPQNLMIDENGRCVILDFGIIRHVDSTLTATGVLAGTPAYIAPEQARDPKRADLRSDLYSLGVTFFEMLTGTLPFVAHSAFDLMFKHQTDPAPRPSSVAQHLPRELDGIVLRLLAKDPAKRYGSAAALKAVLSEIGGTAGRPQPQVLSRVMIAKRGGPVAGSGTGAPPLESEPSAGHRSERWRPVLLGAAVTVLVCAAVLVWLVSRRPPPAMPIGSEVASEVARATPEAEKRTDRSQDSTMPRSAPAAEPSATSGSAALNPTLGQVEVGSVPSGARLKVDGKPAGTTPHTLDLPTGFHWLDLTLTDHGSVRRGIVVEAGKSERVLVQLKKTPATLEVIAKLDDGESGAEISIDGEILGTSERVSSKLAPGSHSVHVRRRGYRSATRRVELRAGENLKVEIELERRSRGRRYRRRRHRRRGYRSRAYYRSR